MGTDEKSDALLTEVHRPLQRRGYSRVPV